MPNTNSFTTSESSFSLRHSSHSPLSRWVSRRLSRSKPMLHVRPTDSDDEERVTESYAAYCRAFTAGQYHSEPPSGCNGSNGSNGSPSSHCPSSSSLDFLPVGAYGFTPLTTLRSPTPPPRVLTPSLYRASSQALQLPHRPWWTRLPCGC
ncbi:hypothetical protein EYZ11_003025 [Aspergillus tanneri]|uniref:Uncharacterized protein n=1 Tax=Aspergillus tanneri TaxID=1220188 RepID=A0A4S3JTW2_9EURO|nr:uncharacterized protein ATNIH1004_008680 [Aspergillus tanneri]KAA8644476.1 hypothetical protein ATNIH1004_008680 [Aspergillus tanneri]THC97491.1 hypothetical protein EYZ11_003025 [Aspergillus tanneri]